MGIRVKLLLPVISILFLPLAARADSITTYIYTGNYFTYADGPFTTSDRITGSFTAPTLADNLDHAPLDVYGYDFTDGIQTLTGSYSIIGNISTDENGSILDWYMQLGPQGQGCGIEGGYDVVPTSDLGEQCVLPWGNTNAYGEVLGLNGTWTIGAIIPTPEPSCLGLLTTGMLGLLGIDRLRSVRGSR